MNLKAAYAAGTNDAVKLDLTAEYPGPGANQIIFTNLEVVTQTEQKERDDFQMQIRDLAIEGDFQKLESLAEDFRVHKTRFRNGDWKLRSFYTAFGEYEKIENDQAYSRLISQLERWNTNQPSSVTPKLALVSAYHGYAWMARTCASADQVSEEGWRLAEQRIKTGFQWLGKARALKSKDPAISAIGLRLCLGAGVTREPYERLFNEGVTNAPDFSALYEYKAYYLFPRWYGEPGEWESFIRSVSKRTDIPHSDEIFARTAIYLREMGFFWGEFSGDATAWMELKNSFHVLEKNYPDSLEIKSIFCRMCLTIRDYKEAREQFKLIGGRVDLHVWNQDFFLEFARWMNSCDPVLEVWKKSAKTKSLNGQK